MSTANDLTERLQAAYRKSQDGDITYDTLAALCIEAADALVKAHAALRPFVEIAKELSPSLNDDHKNTAYWAVPKVSNFRAAESVLS